MFLAEVAIACTGNSLVFKQNNWMLFGDAKLMLEDVLAALETRGLDFSCMVCGTEALQALRTAGLTPGIRMEGRP